MTGNVRGALIWIFYGILNCFFVPWWDRFLRDHSGKIPFWLCPVALFVFVVYIPVLISLGG